MNPTDSFAYHHTAALLSNSPSPESNVTVTQADQCKPDHHLHSSESAAAQQNSVAALPLWSSRGKSGEPQFHQQPSYPLVGEDYLLQNRIYLYWGFPSLHSESLLSTIHVLGDYSSIFIFNRIPNASICQEYPMLFHPLPPSLPEVQPQPSPEILPQAHLPSPLPTLPPGPKPQIRECGGQLHRPQNESDTTTSSAKQHLAWHVLRKQQERLWGLPAVVRRSQEDFSSSALDSANELCPPPQDQVSVSTLPGDFPLSTELRRTLEHHLRKRLIQHRWGLPRRIHQSRSLLRPLSHCSETSKSESNYGLSWLCAYKGRDSGNSSVGWSQRGSFSEWGESELKGQGNSPKDASTDSESSSENDLAYDHDEDIGRHRDLLGENAVFSRQSLRQRQIENLLKIHSSNTFEENNAGRLPAPAPSAWHATTQVPTVRVSSHSDTNQGSVPPSEGGDCCLNTCQELGFLECSAQQCLDSHMKNLCGRMSSGLPPKVLKSMEIFQSKDSSSHSLLNSKLPSSMTLDSEVGSTSGGFMPRRGSTASLHGDHMGTAHSASIPDRPLRATSHGGQEGQGAVSQSPSAIHQGLTGGVQRMRDATQTLQPVIQSITEKESLIQTLLIKKPFAELAAVRAGARHKSKDQNAVSTDRVDRLKSKKMKKESQCVSMPRIRQIFTVKELDAPQSGTSNILTTDKPGVSQNIPVNEINGEASVSTESPSAKTPALWDPRSSGSNEQLPHELQSEIGNDEHSQAQGQCRDMAAASECLAYHASQTQAQGVPTLDKGASQVLYVQGEAQGVGTQQRQEPWLPEHALRCGQDKNFPPAEWTVTHQGPKSEALGGGDPGLGTSPPGRKNIPTQDVSLDEMLGSKSSQTLSQEGLCPPERPLRIKINRFFQWLHPAGKWERQEKSPGMGSRVSSAESRGPEKSRVALSGLTEAPKVMTGLGKFLQEKLGHRHTTDTPCFKEPLPSPVKFGKPQQKPQVPAHSAPIQGHPSNFSAPCCKVTKSCQQAAGLAGQSSTNRRQTRDRDTKAHQKVVAFKEQLSSQRHLQSWPCREAVPHPSLGQSFESMRQMSNQGGQAPKAAALKEQLKYQKYPRSRPQREAVPHPDNTYRRQAGQEPKAAPTTAEGTAF